MRRQRTISFRATYGWERSEFSEDLNAEDHLEEAHEDLCILPPNSGSLGSAQCSQQRKFSPLMNILESDALLTLPSLLLAAHDGAPCAYAGAVQGPS